jgi:hypothetical protein
MTETLTKDETTAREILEHAGSMERQELEYQLQRRLIRNPPVVVGSMISAGRIAETDGILRLGNGVAVTKTPAPRLNGSTPKLKTKACVDCSAEFEPRAPAQKRCDECRAKHVPPSRQKKAKAKPAPTPAPPAQPTDGFTDVPTQIEPTPDAGPAAVRVRFGESAARTVAKTINEELSSIRSRRAGLDDQERRLEAALAALELEDGEAA